MPRRREPPHCYSPLRRSLHRGHTGKVLLKGSPPTARSPATCRSLPVGRIRPEGRGALPRAARCCAALAQPARAVRALWPHFSCRAESARSTSATTDAPSAKAFPCAAKDRLSIRQKFALSSSKGISQSYGLLGLSDRRHLPVDFRHPRRGAASAHGQKYRHRMAAPIVPR